jgi:hypothetical protein
MTHFEVTVKISDSKLEKQHIVQPWPTRGPSTDSDKRYFGAKSIRSLEKTQILALKMAIFQKCGPRVDLGWPWLI